MNKGVKRVLRYLLPRNIRDHRIWRGPLRGFHIVTSWHDYPAAILGRTERPLLEWFERNVTRGETWLDIGAHYGYTSIALSRLVGPEGRVFAFEPMLPTAGNLVRTRRLNGLSQMTVIPFALGSPEALELGKLPSVRGMADSTLGTGEWNEALLISRLDWLWPKISGTQLRIHGVKIDVQGMELQVLQGMSILLELFRPKLVLEFHHGVVRDQVLEVLAAAGYSRKGMPIEPIDGESMPKYLDDRTYAFQSSGSDLESAGIVRGGDDSRLNHEPE